MNEKGEKIDCIPEATISGIPVDKTPLDDFATASLPPPGTSVVSFISKLYELVNNPETQSFISWSEEFQKKAIIIPDPVEFSKQILPRFFKHSNICSFVRQLNIYGFRKLETQNGFCFRHESFVAGRPELLPNIQRKKPTPHRKKQQQTQQTEDDSSSLYQYLLGQLVQLQKQNTETQTQINTLKEMLYQLKLREDTLEMKLYRLSEIVMPSLNYNSPMFNQNFFQQFMSQNMQNDVSNNFTNSMMNFMMQNANQMGMNNNNLSMNGMTSVSTGPNVNNVNNVSNGMNAQNTQNTANQVNQTQSTNGNIQNNPFNQWNMSISGFDGFSGTMGTSSTNANYNQNTFSQNGTVNSTPNINVNTMGTTQNPNINMNLNTTNIPSMTSLNIPQRKNTEDQQQTQTQQNTDGFVSWDFQSQIPWKF